MQKDVKKNTIIENTIKNSISNPFINHRYLSDDIASLVNTTISNVDVSTADLEKIKKGLWHYKNNIGFYNYQMVYKFENTQKEFNIRNTYTKELINNDPDYLPGIIEEMYTSAGNIHIDDTINYKIDEENFLIINKSHNEIKYKNMFHNSNYSENILSTTKMCFLDGIERIHEEYVDDRSKSVTKKNKKSVLVRNEFDVRWACGTLISDDNPYYILIKQLTPSDFIQSSNYRQYLISKKIFEQISTDKIYPQDLNLKGFRCTEYKNGHVKKRINGGYFNE